MAKSFKQLVKKTANKKTRAIAKKRTKELTREVLHAKLIFGELTFGEFYKFLCKRLKNKRPASVLVEREENQFRLAEEFYAHSFELVGDKFLKLSGTKDNDGKLCSVSIPLEQKIKIKDDVVELRGWQVIRLTFFHEPPSIDVFKQISGS